MGNIIDFICEPEKVEEPHNVEFVPLPEDRQALIRKYFPNYRGLVETKPGGYCITPDFARHSQSICNMEIRPDDFWVMTFPKSGTTWVQELVWLLVNDCDFEGAKQPIDYRAPFLEVPFIAPRLITFLLTYFTPFRHYVTDLSRFAAMKSPRCIKTHLPFYLLPPKLLDTCKVVYVARNPKDVIVSYYFHHRLVKFQTFLGNMEEFTDFFMRNEVLFAPYFPHVLEAWARRDHPNMLFLFYEDLKRDLKGQIQRVAQFLNKPVSEDMLCKLRDYFKFDTFSRNEAVNRETGLITMLRGDEREHFMRKGKTGDWQNHFSPKLNKKIDDWIEQNLSGSDIKFVTKLDIQD